ncbi:MFS transporter [Candidatus Cyrtobacter comes]|uniref:MFS transporter n=1 Tax=Candidatus Cyrtobacter comes TaxID=675776 RepID=UPI002ACD8724|nr:MFS transporter [Candidatus Cyrtobacter comes]
MTHVLLPAIWLIVLIVGLPQLSETVYTPSLPEIAHELRTSETMVEYTLTIYLFGFALGTLFWGKISDKLGRKPYVIAGLLVFIIGCIGCYFSTSIEILMISRLIQAFGGSYRECSWPSNLQRCVPWPRPWKSIFCDR